MISCFMHWSLSVYTTLTHETQRVIHTKMETVWKHWIILMLWHSMFLAFNVQSSPHPGERLPIKYTPPFCALEHQYPFCALEHEYPLLLIGWNSVSPVVDWLEQYIPCCWLAGTVYPLLLIGWNSVWLDFVLFPTLQSQGWVWTLVVLMHTLDGQLEDFAEFNEK